VGNLQDMKYTQPCAQRMLSYKLALVLQLEHHVLDGGGVLCPFGPSYLAGCD
jgi:hypothetical protein